MGRKLDTATLDSAAQYYGSLFVQDAGERNRDWVIGQFYAFTFKDEFEHLVAQMREQLGRKPMSEFDSAIARLAKEHPRTDETFADLLATKLAIDPDGNHIPGMIGSTDLGARVVGRRDKVLKLRDGRTALISNKPIYWPIYAGEAEERIAGNIREVIGEGPGADPLPDTAEPLPVGALNTRISVECAILGLDAIVDNLDEGTGAAVQQGRTGAQPADPDAAVTGTLLFTLTYSATAFGAAADNTDKATATAAAITDDSSADATGTLGYCRVSATNDGVTPLDDHLDGEAGTAGADFNFNTVSIVAGAVVSMSAHTVDLPQF